MNTLKKYFFVIVCLCVIPGLLFSSCTPSPQPTVEATSAPVSPQPTVEATSAPVTNSPTSSAPFVIALAGPFTGANAEYGEFMKNGANLAVKDINGTGGIDGRQIQIQLADDQMDPKQAPLVAQRLSQDSSVLAVIGHFASTSTIAALPIYDRVGVPVLSHSTSQNLTGMSRWFFRLAPTNDIQGKQLADFTVQVLGAKKVAVMFEEGEGTQTVEKPFEAEMAQIGGDIVDKETHQVNDTDFAAQITKIRAFEPEVVFLNTFANEAALIVKQSNQAGWTPIFVSIESTATQDFIDLAGKASEGVYCAAFWNPASTDPEVQKYVEEYKAAYGATPEAYGAETYTAVMMFAEALKAGARTREEIRDWLDKTGTTAGFHFASGNLKWDKNHDPFVPMLVLQVQNGKWIYSPKQLP